MIKRGNGSIMKKLFQIVSIIVGLFVVVLIIINICNKEFWSITAGNAISLFVAVYFAFLGTQYFSDERKTKENVERLILKLQYEVNKESFSKVSSSEGVEELKKRHMMATRRISNILSTLEKSASKLRFMEEWKYINTEFKEYREVFDEHLADLEFLSKSESILRNYAEKIDSKCDEIISALYL